MSSFQKTLESIDYAALKKLDYAATDVWFSSSTINVMLTDGREISVPLGFYPFLVNATEEQRKKFELTGRGTEIHFEEIDEGIDVTDIVLGIPYRA